MSAVMETYEAVEKAHTFSLVPPEHCPLVWADGIYEMLKPAVERSGGRWTMHNLLIALCLGQQNLWVAYDSDKKYRAAITTQVVSYPNCRMLAFQFLGGVGFDAWSDDMLALLERYARDTGCDGMEAVGRFGFWPFFKGKGFRRSYVTYEKQVERNDA